jgi:hypothetical protein
LSLFREETDDPLVADRRNFFRVELWTEDGPHIERLLFAGNSIDKARALFAAYRVGLLLEVFERLDLSTIINSIGVARQIFERIESFSGESDLLVIVESPNGRVRCRMVSCALVQNFAAPSSAAR